KKKSSKEETARDREGHHRRNDLIARHGRGHASDRDKKRADHQNARIATEYRTKIERRGVAREMTKHEDAMQRGKPEKDEKEISAQEFREHIFQVANRRGHHRLNCAGLFFRGKKAHG